MRWHPAAGALLAALAMPVYAAAPEPTVVQVPSLAAGQGATALGLNGWWYPAPTAAGAAPAVLLLHGCGGMLNPQGQPSAKTREYAALLHAQGWHVLALDSFTTRGEKELCTQRIGTRKITQTERRRDALGALQWLAAQGRVDAGRLALLGWSNGGSTVLAATNLQHAEVRSASVKPRFAAAFYPGCEADARRGYRPVSDTLLLVGLADDWTAAEPCQRLAQDGPPSVKVLAYEGAYHGFDGSAPLRLRADVPNGVHPGQGVHVGSHAVARVAAQQALLQALKAAFAP